MLEQKIERLNGAFVLSCELPNKRKFNLKLYLVKQRRNFDYLITFKTIVQNVIDYLLKTCRSALFLQKGGAILCEKLENKLDKRD